MRLGIVDFFVTGLDGPLPPRGNNLHFRRKRLNGQLKAYLIVALAGAAVADGVRALGLRDFDQPFCNQRPCKRGAEQIFVLVDGAGF